MSPLNIIIARFNSPMNRSTVERALKGMEIGYYGCLSDRREALLPLKATEKEFFDTRELKWGNYSCDWNKIAPLDESIIQSMRECEAVVLEMLSRLEEHRYLRYEDRKRLYLTHLRYWNDRLDKKNIDTYLPIGMPHEMPDYVIYCLCRAKGIRILHFLSDAIKDTLFLMDDLERFSVQLKERYEALRGSRYSVLSDKFERYYLDQVSDPDPKPWGLLQHFPTPRRRWWIMTQGILKNDPIRFLWQMLCFVGRRFTLSYWGDVIEQSRKYSRTKEAILFYKQHTDKPDLSKRYIYIPLHLQPECSTCPLGGAFVDQQLMVNLIAAYVPDDVFLYVKEHPNQFVQYPDGRCRDIAFYRELLRGKNVRFIPSNTNTFQLTEHALAVATVTGTAGFEALFRGKPVLMFGHRPYQYAPGVLRIRTRKDCEAAMQSILQGSAGPSLEDVRRFLKAMEEKSIDGYFDAPPLYDIPSAMTMEESVRNIAAALRAKIIR